MRVALVGIGRFRVVSALPQLHTLYQRESAHVVLRILAADAIARINHEESLDLIKAILDDTALDELTRCRAARALIRRGNRDGRDYLVESYQEYLADVRGASVRHEAPLQILKEMSDKTVVKTLRKMLAKEPLGTTRYNIDTVTATMELNSLTEAELLKIASDDQWQQNDRRYIAIQALGRKSSADMIPALKKLPPWRTKGEGAIQGSENYRLGQQKILDRFVSDAIAEIKRRTWSALQKRTTDIPNRTRNASDSSTDQNQLNDEGNLDAKLAAFYCNQAVKEFDQFKKKVTAREFDALLKHLLDNGKIIDEEKLSVRPDKLNASLERIHAQVKSINALDVTPSDFSVSKTVQESKLGDSKSMEVAVTFKLAGTGSIGKRLGPQSGIVNTVAKDGCLIVLMKNIDGKWYWNPFGW